MLEEAENAWKGTLEKVFKTDSGENDGSTAVFVAGKNDSADGNVDENGLFHTNHVYICNHKIAKPRVFIPVFPGTNCEYDLSLIHIYRILLRFQSVPSERIR